MNVEKFLLKLLRKKPFDQFDDVEAAKSFMDAEQYADFFCEVLVVEAKLAMTLDDKDFRKLSALVLSLQPVSDHKLRGHLFAIDKMRSSLGF